MYPFELICLILLFLKFHFDISNGLSFLPQTNYTKLLGHTIDLKYEIICKQKKLQIRPLFQYKNVSAENCTVIEGNLYIAKIAKIPSLPRLKEITGSLYVLFIPGDSLESYLPNLVVVRGSSMALPYSVIVSKTKLKSIGLPSLRLIQRGTLLISQNAQLCYMQSIQWDRITTGQKYFEANRVICPDFCPNTCRYSSSDHFPVSGQFCWSSNVCQSICSSKCSNRDLTCQLSDPTICCDPQCLGGCYGPGPHLCAACKHVLHKGLCMDRCPDGYYTYMNRRCISKVQCNSILVPDRYIFWSTHMGKCIKHCPPGFARNETGSCYNCGSQCPKIRCGSAIIYSAQDLIKVNGCYSLKTVYISIREGSGELSKQLESAFSHLREIETTLKIIRSLALVSLNFLRNLKIINSMPANNKTEYVFQLIGNENLQEIWNVNSTNRLVINQGAVNFNLNRKLCVEKIITFLENGVTLPKQLDDNMKLFIKKSNGDLASCNMIRLQLEVMRVSATSIIYRCNRRFADSGTMSTLVMHKPTQRNITAFDDRTFCGGDSWSVSEPELYRESKITNLSDFWHEWYAYKLTHLTPATRYALYIETKATLAQDVGLSAVVYFVTKPMRPSPPVELQLSASRETQLRFVWSPPDRPNGRITHYIISYRKVPLNPSEFEVQNCDYIPWTNKYKSPSWRMRQHAKDMNERNKLLMNSLLEASAANESCTCTLCTKFCKKHRAKIEETNRLSYVDQFEIHLFNVHFRHRNYNRMASNPIVMTNSTNENSTNSRPLDNLSATPLTTVTIPTVTTDAIPVATVTKSTPKPDTSVEFHKESPEVPWEGREIVASTESSILLSNLSYFTEYAIVVVACQANVSDEDYVPQENLPNLPRRFYQYLTSSEFEWDDSYTRRYCSERAFTSYRTLPYIKADSLDANSIATQFDGTVWFFWNSPLEPNGLVLHFVIGYRVLLKGEVIDPNDISVATNHSKWKYVCVTYRDFIANGRTKGLDSYKYGAGGNVVRGGLSLDLLPGTYAYHIRAQSLAGNGSWTSGRIVTVPAVTPPLEDFMIAVIIVIIVFFLMVIFIIWLIAFCNTNKQQLIESSCNPEYYRDEWEIRGEDMKMDEVNALIGQGSFGKVYKAELTKLETPARHYFSSNRNVPVAIKMIDPESSPEERNDFLKEMRQMRQKDCFHIVKFLGQVSVRHRLGRVPLVVMEFMDNGDLASFLRKTGDENTQGKVEEARAIKWAIEIADGMAYLETIKVVHRDLAARNCLLNSKLVAKIADFGMARDIMEDNYYRNRNHRAKVPIRWMAPESMPESMVFTSKSDVWSYGVVLWEIGTLASVPYNGMSHQEIIDFVINGYNLGIIEWPKNCPPILLSIMENCWQYDATERPTFHDILESLEGHMNPEFREVSYFHNGLMNSDHLPLGSHPDPDEANNRLPHCSASRSDVEYCTTGTRATFISDGTEHLSEPRASQNQSQNHSSAILPIETHSLLSHDVLPSTPKPKKLLSRFMTPLIGKRKNYQPAGAVVDSDSENMMINLRVYSCGDNLGDTQSQVILHNAKSEAIDSETTITAPMSMDDMRFESCNNVFEDS